MKKLTTRQSAILLCISIITIKLLVLPSAMANYAKKDVYIAVTISLIIDFIFIFLILLVMKKHPDSTFKEIIQTSFGKVLSKIIFFILTIYFLVRCIITIQEVTNYFSEVLFEEFPFNKLLIPMFLVLVYSMTKSLRSIGRSAEFLIFVILAGAVISVILPLRDLELESVLPILENGVGPVMKSVFLTSFGFGDYFILFILMGNIKMEKGKVGKFIKYALIGEIFIIIFNFIFASIFSEIGLAESIAVNSIPLYSNLLHINGRLEWISIFIWAMTLLLQSSIVLNCAKISFNNTFNIKKDWISISIIVAIIYSVIYIFNFRLADSVDIIVTVPFATTVVAVQFLMPVLLVTGAIIKSNRQVKNERFN